MMPPMSPRILFIGAGAIGSYLGAFLSRSGHDVKDRNGADHFSADDERAD